ncbi:MAG: methyl-accepting chemotaxis protein [Candidatus Magnetoovum sp. WYHC-5]|nr:methyl-accepting chemotaxis protein [Candidatus Magnetoovum sp. WYHC-5]
MDIFKNMPIKYKFLVGYVLIFAVFIVSSYLSYSSIDKLLHKVEEEGQTILDISKTIADKSDKLKEMEANVSDVIEQSKAEASSISTITLASGVIIFLVIAVIWYLINESVTKPINILVDSANAIASGDLTINLNGLSQGDEIGELIKAVGRMKDALNEIISEISNTADQVNSAVLALSETVRQITRKVDDQAGRANQVATSSTEMSQTVMDIAKNAAEIASSAGDTLNTAKNGADVVGKTVAEVQEISRTVTDLASVMTSLGDRSKQIGEIVGVINDIADQTNLLALNAAIEAARAGEQGRGFAVVADEVRKLAEKTAKATMEISEMIQAIQNETDKAVTSMDESLVRVESGANFSTQAGDALQRIVSSVQDLQTMVQQIASATEEMSSVTEQMGGDIEAIANAASETSSDTGQVADASTNLSSLSENLQSILSRFKGGYSGGQGGRGGRGGSGYGKPTPTRASSKGGYQPQGLPWDKRKN